MKKIRIHSAFRYSLCLVGLLSFHANALTLEQAKKETAHITSLKEAKAFMEFNPHVMYRKALSGRELISASKVTCIDDAEQKTMWDTDTLNLKGHDVAKSAKFNDDGRLIEESGQNWKGVYKYSDDGKLITKKLRRKNSFEFNGQLITSDEVETWTYKYTGTRRISAEITKIDYTSGQKKEKSEAYDYDDDFGEYCISSVADSQVNNRWCYNIKHSSTISHFTRDWPEKGVNLTEHFDLDENGNILSVTQSIMKGNNTLRKTKVKECSYKYVNRSFQFYGPEL